jgi:hypothetical protein
LTFNTSYPLLTLALIIYPVSFSGDGQIIRRTIAKKYLHSPILLKKYELAYVFIHLSIMFVNTRGEGAKRIKQIKQMKIPLSPDFFSQNIQMKMIQANLFLFYLIKLYIRAIRGI